MTANEIIDALAVGFAIGAALSVFIVMGECRAEDEDDDCW